MIQYVRLTVVGRQWQNRDSYGSPKYRDWDILWYSG
jgi:hypothetical protein